MHVFNYYIKYNTHASFERGGLAFLGRDLGFLNLVGIEPTLSHYEGPVLTVKL